MLITRTSAVVSAPFRCLAPSPLVPRPAAAGDGGRFDALDCAARPHQEQLRLADPAPGRDRGSAPPGPLCPGPDRSSRRRTMGSGRSVARLGWPPDRGRGRSGPLLGDVGPRRPATRRGRAARRAAGQRAKKTRPSPAGGETRRVSRPLERHEGDGSRRTRRCPLWSARARRRAGPVAADGIVPSRVPGWLRRASQPARRSARRRAPDPVSGPRRQRRRGGGRERRRRRRETAAASGRSCGPDRPRPRSAPRRGCRSAARRA